MACALDATIQAGDFAGGFERWYADDVVMCEIGGPETVGKERNRARESAFFRAISQLNARLLGVAADGDTSYSEWELRLHFRTGRTFELRQIAARRWRDDLVLRETFYHVPFPSWTIDEIRAASTDGLGTGQGRD